MTAQKYIKIQEIDDKSPHLPSVIELWRRNRATLGLLPKGAFEERAAKRQILVALDPQVGCVGYILYRHSYDRITIVHLCIAPSHRNQGLAKLLVDYLKEITQEKYSGIGLSCRRDYNLQLMWSNLGFVPLYDKPGRGKDNHLLTFWWFDHGHLNLFSTAPKQKLESKLCVVIDAKIFFDLYANEDCESVESKALLADWLEPVLELCITDEIFNYINIRREDNERKYQLNIAKSFTCLPYISKNLDVIMQFFQEDFIATNTLRDEFCLRNLAKALASDCHIFLTKEESLLEIADKIYEKFNLSILAVNDLLIQIDELCNKPDYQPVRLAGTQLDQVRVQRGQEDLLTNYFCCVNSGETKAKFQQKLRRFVTEIDKFECYVVNNKENQLLALVVYGRHKNNELEIPILRVADNLLSATLARHLIFKSILCSTRESRQFTRITDSYLQATVIQAIQEDAFVTVNNGWLKVNLQIAETASYISEHLTNLASDLGQEYNFCRQIATSLKAETLITDVQACIDIEKFLFPGKIIDAEIPAFIIPIKPRWAIDLFDEGLANQTLLGAKLEFAFNREAVYYSSANNSKLLKAPYRILWYVTQGDDKHDHYYYGVGSIRACSVANEVVIGKPKELYQRFQRLGIYKLADILNMKTMKNGNIMAIRFSHTELFTNHIYFRIIKNLKSSINLQSPYRIDKNLFKQLYNLGMNK
ncbi:MAG: GNAT family N-acetyltransferase [Tolypothrix brevis GSE-NOS-MK-07-07A]|nr:GNAT family N-acetyltransferase [Tolypothrix brevis GSE-NOS-MK-07-07A]